MKWALSSKCINEIHRLLSVHLSRDMSDQILDIQNDLEYSDIHLSISGRSILKIALSEYN